MRAGPEAAADRETVIEARLHQRVHGRRHGARVQRRRRADRRSSRPESRRSLEVELDPLVAWPRSSSRRRPCRRLLNAAQVRSDSSREALPRLTSRRSEAGGAARRRRSRGSGGGRRGSESSPIPEATSAVPARRPSPSFASNCSLNVPRNVIPPLCLTANPLLEYGGEAARCRPESASSFCSAKLSFAPSLCHILEDATLMRRENMSSPALRARAVGTGRSRACCASTP